jgi:hypothetical protein
MIYDIDSGVGAFLGEMTVRRYGNTFWVSAFLAERFVPERGPAVVIGTGNTLSAALDDVARKMPEDDPAGDEPPTDPKSR